MKGRFLVNSNEDPTEGNIYADKSALILDWLLREGVRKQGFSLREVAKENRSEHRTSPARLWCLGIERNSPN